MKRLNGSKMRLVLIGFLAALIVTICTFTIQTRATTGGDAIIYPTIRKQLITDWGYDIKWKQKGKDLTPSYAQTIFVTDKFTCLRLPIWGDAKHQAHPADGVVVASEYQSTLNAMTNARNARSDVVFFASKKLNGQTSFPDWVKCSPSGPIIPSQYARMIADFLEFMESNGFNIDILGIDNEWEYNEGDITPQRHKDTIDELNSLAVSRGFKVPLIIGPDMYGTKNGGPWLNTLVSNGWGDRLDMAGTHYYPQWRPLANLQLFCQYAGSRPKWHTEVHWKNYESLDYIEEAELCLVAVFDCFDEGLSGMSWWNYQRFGSTKGEIERKLTTTTIGSQPIDMDDIDGRYMNYGELITRAFIKGNQVAVWVINEPSTAYSSYGFSLNSGSITGPIDYTQWTDSSTSTGTATTINDKRFELTIPGHTVTLIEFLISQIKSPDFNGDGIVDCADICIMVDHWHTDEPACDIAPPPFGDGIVDVQDLIVLAEHLLTYPGAVAYWKLDETEGDIAYDSVGDCNGTLVGGPAWQPTGGMVAGALQLDGIYDYISTPFVLNPADGKFSVFAWIKGGAPGEVIISQTGGVDWLLADPSDGKLMTGLTPPAGRFTPPLLISEFVITDNVWHRIGFVWDGSYRTLYVDGAEVAKDTQTQGNLIGAHGGLHIGAGSTLDAGSFFSGLIDDVRIYNRVVTP